MAIDHVIMPLRSVERFHRTRFFLPVTRAYLYHRAAMAITFKTPDGLEVTVSDVTEAAQLIQELRKLDEKAATAVVKSGAETAIQAPAHHRSNGAVARPEDGDFSHEAAQTALRFLKAIRDGAPAGGVQSDVMMTALGVTVPKAVGSKSASVNKVIAGVGLKPKKVYLNPKTANGRIWKPGRQLIQAIQLIEQRLAVH